MSNGQQPPHDPQNPQAPTGIAGAPQGYAPVPDATPQLAQPATAGQDVNAELAELRAFRDKAGQLQTLVNEVGGDALYQHFTNYAQMMQQQQPQGQPAAQQPAQQPAANDDPWGYQDDSRQESVELTNLREEIVRLKSQLGQLTHHTGLDKIESHSRRFFEQEWPDLLPEERQVITNGMHRQLDAYSQTEAGRAFLSNPRYEAVRALAFQHLPPQTMENVLRRKIARETQGRQQMRTDSPTPSTGQEGMDLSTDTQTAWDRSLEAIQRETL
jgi:hypothetical protein